MKSTRVKAAGGRSTTRGSSPAKPSKKAAPKKVASKKAAPKKVAKKVAKAAPKKVAPKKVVKAAPKKVTKAAPKKVAPRKSAKATPGTVAPAARMQTAVHVAATPARRERVAPTPLVKTGSSGIGPSGALARGPADVELRAGDDLPALSRPAVTRVDIARYCAASGDFNLIALDEPRARDVGLPSVVVPGSLAFALADACVRAWLGRDGRVWKSGARLVKMVWPDDELVAHARVSHVKDEPSGREIELDVWVENQKGELVLRGQCTCLVGAADHGQ